MKSNKRKNKQKKQEAIVWAFNSVYLQFRNMAGKYEILDID